MGGWVGGWAVWNPEQRGESGGAAKNNSIGIEASATDLVWIARLACMT